MLPNITIRLVNKNSEPTLVITRNDSDRLNLIQWPMSQLEPAGYQALCQIIGDRAMRMLAVVQHDEIAKFPRLLPPKLHTETYYGIVDALIQRSYKEKTTAYIPAIDRLIEQRADELNESSLPETWPANRENLIKAFSG